MITAQKALFAEAGFESYKFPAPQYLGAKINLLDWLARFIPSQAETALDAFAGSQSVAYFLKQKGWRVYTNDFLASCHHTGAALIENGTETLSFEESNLLFRSQEHSGRLMVENFVGIFFSESEAQTLDSFRANVRLLDSSYKQSLALAVMNRSLTRKIIMGHFAHTQALAYASNPSRVKRNPSIAQPIKEIFFKLLPEYNHAVFDNGKENQSFNENILDLLPKLNGIDLIYFDPPYTDSHSDYQSFYHLTETFTRYWSDRKFVNATRRYEPQLWSGFDKKAEVEKSFEQLFENARDVPHWLISFNDRSFPSISRLAEMISRHKDVTIEAKPYLNSRGGKGSVAGSHEILFVCRNRTRVFVEMETKDFDFWKRRYDANELADFNFDSSGLLWLKLKSLTRKGLLDDFIATLSLDASTARTLAAKWEHVFAVMQKQDTKQVHQTIDNFIRTKHQSQLESFNERELVSELYNLKFYDWGGDYKNNLDKYLVDNFIKVHRSYDELNVRIEGEIASSVKGYVLNSWYNHWSSILIENIFKAHRNVLPTVGQIKKVDFFINQIPFDLKVTNLPVNFIEDKRKSYGLKPELTELKQQARKLGISFQKHKKASDTYYEIVQKLKDKDSEESLAALKSVNDVRKQILDGVSKQPHELIKNLYEKQGEMRFDASNRLFLILVDSTDYDNSWKLRRNLDLLKPTINYYLDSFANKSMDELKIDFKYAGKEYRCLADCVFVTK